jgi:hypothetical protein
MIQSPLENVIVAQPVKKFRAVIDCGGLLLCLEKPAFDLTVCQLDSV